ncbi:unnamed protein product [Cylindrotheca closterium]|uniref:Kinesin light chain n=1 Tax=Cylindrotheca closterium TaxID=2856 RepID=A0AAD2GC48_9STRA|nr:unnamed protein product [Cylindrotheca closterium]
MMEGKCQDSVIQELMNKCHIYQFEEGNSRKARETLETVLEIQTEDLGEDDIAVAKTLMYIGSILREEGDFNEAFEKLNRSLAIRVKKLGRHCDTADSYEEIGITFQRQGEHEQAKEMFREALDIKREILPNDHIEVTGLYEREALSLSNQGKFSEAIKVYKVQLAAILQIHGEFHPSVAHLYQGIAMLLKLQNRLDDAVQLLDKSIEISSRLQRVGDFDMKVLGSIFRHKAKIQNQQGNLEGATETWNKVLMIRIETVGEMHPKTAETYEELALVYIRQDIIEGAIESYAKAINIRRKELGDDHSNTKELVLNRELLQREKYQRILRNQGLAMQTEGDSEKAEQLFQEANEILKEKAAIFENLSAVKVDQGMLDDAIATSAEALKIRRRTLGDEDAGTRLRTEAHRSLLKRLLENRS